MGETYYDLLGVSEDASTDEIERAYRERVKEEHPDVSNREDASDVTKRLIRAREILTDEESRKQYDRAGHDTYVGASEATQPDAEATTQNTDTATSHTETTTAGACSTETAKTAGQTDNVGTGPSWAGRSTDRDTRRRPNSRANSTWSVDRTYGVSYGTDVWRFGGLLRNQQAFVLLWVTFLIYPVLLYGALTPTFPLGVNLLVATCAVFVIAFLQSMPEVGIVVFGGWTLLLPLLLLLGVETSTFPLRTVLAFVAVLFPFGLSVLTRVAVRPRSA